MSGSFLSVLTAGLLSAFFCTLGILTVWKHRDWAERSTNYFMYFASGVLISVAFLIAAPKALEMNDYGPVYLLAGFLGIFLINKFVDVYVCTDEYCRITIVAAFGIAFHSFVDGIIFSTTFAVSAFIGVMATFGMIFHEFPEGVVTYSLFTRGGFKSERSFLYSFLVAAATTPIGAMISFPFISSLGSQSLGLLLGLSAGVLIYVGATHLLSEAEKEGKPYGLAAFILGIAVSVGLWLIKGGV